MTPPRLPGSALGVWWEPRLREILERLTEADIRYMGFQAAVDRVLMTNAEDPERIAVRVVEGEEVFYHHRPPPFFPGMAGMRVIYRNTLPTIHVVDLQFDN